MQQIEAIRRQRSVPDLYTDTSLAGLGARYWAEGEYNLRANQNGATQAAAGVRMGKPTWPTSVRFRDFVRP
ncbi:MAG TPA: hypothetical protein VEG60_31620 [Candidatus Binatia bacterium]|nr:hypothetical protein [Candidatus Binatia bacterium]